MFVLPQLFIDLFELQMTAVENTVLPLIWRVASSARVLILGAGRADYQIDVWPVQAQLGGVRPIHFDADLGHGSANNFGNLSNDFVLNGGDFV